MNVFSKKKAASIALTFTLLIPGLAGCTSASATKKADPAKVEKVETKTAAATDNKALPNVKILATGGTIAGAAKSESETTGYKAGVVGVDQLVEAVPELKELANISGQQVCKIDSSAMTNEILLDLAKEVDKQLKDPKINGIVITHGTDTLEETAYFLNLVIKSDKPVVLVGSMRPSTALSADGPLNLYNAVAIAASEESKGKGVLVALNDKIGSARDTTKTNTTSVDTFGSQDFGYLGLVQGGKPYFYTESTRKNTTETEFNVNDIKDLPRVDIVYAHGNDSRVMVDAAVKAGAKAIIHAGTGNGSVYPETLEGLIDAQKKGVVVVRDSKVGSGMVTREDVDDKNHFVSADTLNPVKARVLLMLALSKTNDPAKIQEMFNQY
ncbi:type II asparaginase [Mesobacillus zeae]|uniref:asparaginase n=1 Tax=Mesobacillus zeae TaxID=1917180 RepID=A0A398B1N2_9BACI|nr:type II asparaginase [Mesobacillus zeae]RID83571.1 type II asparaginase [Mesobacillus zeae]